MLHEHGMVFMHMKQFHFEALHIAS